MQVVVKFNILILDHFKYILSFFDNFDNAYFSVRIFAVLTVHKISVGLSFSNLLAYKSALIEISVKDYIHFSRIFVRGCLKACLNACLKAVFAWQIELGVLVGHQVFNLSSHVTLLVVSSNYNFVLIYPVAKRKGIKSFTLLNLC